VMPLRVGCCDGCVLETVQLRGAAALHGKMVAE
jgi:hypothetical protein